MDWFANASIDSGYPNEIWTKGACSRKTKVMNNAYTFLMYFSNWWLVFSDSWLDFCVSWSNRHQYVASPRDLQSQYVILSKGAAAMAVKAHFIKKLNLGQTSPSWSVSYLYLGIYVLFLYFQALLSPCWPFSIHVESLAPHTGGLFDKSGPFRTNLVPLGPSWGSVCAHVGPLGAVWLFWVNLISLGPSRVADWMN